MGFHIAIYPQKSGTNMYSRMYVSMMTYDACHPATRASRAETWAVLLTSEAQ